jgi:RHS repeat-associated protein
VSDSGIVLARYDYDAQGRRVLKVLDENADGTPDKYVHFYLNGQQVIETREAASSSAQPESLNPTYQYVWSPRYVDSLILRDSYTGGVLQAASRLYYLNDGNFNVTALLNASGVVLERYAYTPYGKTTVLDADFTLDANNLSDFSNTTLFAGRELDPETGLYYNRARYYSAELGRFVARDPIQADVALYRYCGNNSIARVDPSGLKWHIERKGQSRAVVSNDDPHDTISNLAEIVHLDADEFRLWLKRADQGGVPSSIGQVGGCREFTVPNRVLLYISKRSTFDFGVAVAQCRLAAASAGIALRSVGYELVGRELSSAPELKKMWRDPDIVGFFFGGHGNPVYGIVADESIGEAVAPQDVKPGYHLAFVGIYACFGGSIFTDINGTSMSWRDHVANGGHFAAKDGYVWPWDIVTGGLPSPQRVTRP